jgi:hypothetical protein
MAHTLADTARSSTTAQSGEIGTYAASFGISLGLTSLFNALLVVIKETNETTILAWMKAAGHHWITHGVLDLVVFVVLGFALAKFGQEWRRTPGKVTASAVGGVVVGALIIAAFYLRHLM